MFATPATRESRPVGVLLGGSGRVRIFAVRAPVLPALLKPLSSAPGRLGSAGEARVAAS